MINNEFHLVDCIHYHIIESSHYHICFGRAPSGQAIRLYLFLRAIWWLHLSKYPGRAGKGYRYYPSRTFKLQLLPLNYRNIHTLIADKILNE